MNRLDQYILKLEKLCGQEIPGAQGSFSDFFRAIWLEIVVAFRFICATIGPFLLAYVPAGIAVGVYHLLKRIWKVDKNKDIYCLLYRYGGYPTDHKVFYKDKWEQMSDKEKQLLISNQIPLEMDEKTFFELYDKYNVERNKCWDLETRFKWIISVPTVLFYVLAAYPYYLMVGATVTTIVVAFPMMAFFIFLLLG